MHPARRLARSAAAAVAAGACAAAAAVACGGPQAARLDAAGTPGDDGSGLIARASVRLLGPTDDDGFDPEPTGGYAYGYGYGYDYHGVGGFTYGPFGGDDGAHGGTTYASYQPTLSQQPVSRAVDYAVAAVTDGGAIEGVVTWPKAPARPATLAGLDGCDPVANRSVVLGAGNTVEGAIVHLERIASGRAFVTHYFSQAPIPLGGSVELRGCALTPRVQVHMPAPGHLTLTSSHDAAVTLVAERTDRDGAARARLERGGSHAVTVAGAGVTRVTDEDGRLAPAWVVSAGHPYFAMTDARGRFRIDDVKPGEYTLVVWHPPAVTGAADGRVTYGEPVVVTRKVVVKATAATRADVALP